MRRSMKSIAWRFQSTPPARGATTSCDPRFPSRNDFNPRPPRGGRRRQFFLILAAVHFNPRPPRGGRPFCCFCSDFQIDSFQSTPPARGATNRYQKKNYRYQISIHAPREGGDGDLMAALLTSLGISIHAPREGGDGPTGRNHIRNSTISIHAPREGGDSGSSTR